MAANRLRLAIVGVGSWGTRAHLPAFAQRDDVEVVALADPRIDLVRAVAEQFAIRHLYADASTLLREQAGLDAVVLAVPTDQHHDLVLAALDAGAHVLCEKPLAFNLAQAREMTDAARRRGRVTKMGFLFRFSPVVERMKGLVDEGLIGEVRLFESVTVNAQFVDPAKPLHWKMLRERANGGVFVEYGSHSIDLALWFGGPITSVVAHGVTLVPERRDERGQVHRIRADDAAAWIATYAHGGEALFRTGWASLPVGGGGLRVYGTRGSLAWQLDPTTRRSERLIAATAEQPEPQTLFEYTPPFEPLLDAGPFPIGLLARYNARLAESFVRDIRVGRSSGPSFEDGLAVQAVLEAIRASLDERRWVDVEPTGRG